MIETIETLRNIAGLMFWGMVDVFLGLCWLAGIMGLIVTIFKGIKFE